MKKINLFKKFNERGLTEKTIKTISGFDREALENGLLEYLSETDAGKRIGLKSGRLWKRDGNKYRIIDQHNLDENINGTEISSEHTHVKRVMSKGIVINTKRDREQFEKDLGVGSNYVEISYHPDYILALDMKEFGINRDKYIVSNEIGRSISNAIKKMEINEKTRRSYGRLKNLVKLAGEMQESLLPKDHPDFFGFDVFGINEKAYDLGGDYYDFLNIDDKLRIAIADVAGHDIASSTKMFGLHAGVSVGRDQNVEKMMKKLNKYLFHNKNEDDDVYRFVTGILMDLNSEGGFEYVNAGHEYPLLAGNDGLQILEGTDLMLAVDPEATYIKKYGKLNKDDVLLLYTDGITESMSEKEEEFGIKRLGEALMDYRKLPSEEIGKNIFDVVKRYGKNDDDRTIVLIKKEY